MVVQSVLTLLVVAMDSGKSSSQVGGAATDFFYDPFFAFLLIKSK